MRYSIDSLGRPARERMSGLGQCPLMDEQQQSGLGQIVVSSGSGRFGGGSRFVFRQIPQPYSYYYPYYYYRPAYQYPVGACPVSIALTAAQSAAVAAGQIVTVAAQNQCGATIQVTVQGAASAPPAGRAANAPTSTIY